TYTTELGDTAVLSPSLVNTARIQFQLASPITEFDPVINSTQFVVPISTGGDSKEFGGPIFLGQLTYNTCTQALSICEGSTYLDNITNVRTYTQSYGN